ncbi:hypothetical protein [Uliginosibacterium sp. H1]|uniref:hypothetical protein n=1 Tax=Uliginosibacterium sp. H1 TaxID=3114757 RepID=UPI002E178211|nr:hypothetical protein [Uliginosibacterium sp. H1]
MEYRDYADVPTHRRQWFFWLSFLLLTPFAVCLVIFGDIYYRYRGGVKSFGIFNRVLAAVIGAVWGGLWY